MALKFVLLLLMCCLSESMPLASAEECMLTHAEQVSYNGKQAVLEGNVAFGHPLGRLFADKIVFDFSQNGNLNHLRMDGRVKIAFEKGGELTCNLGEIDVKQLTGNFNANPACFEDFVVYREARQNGQNNKHLIEVKSRCIQVEASKDNLKGVSHNAITQLTAKKDVEISYNRSFLAVGDRAIYIRSNGCESDSPKSFVGKLKMFSEGGKCHFSSFLGDHIAADELNFDTESQIVILHFPEGNLRAIRGNEDSEISFSSELLEWDNQKGMLILKENVRVVQPGIGALETMEARLWQRHEGEKVGKLQAMQAIGQSVLTYEDSKANLTYVLTCKGYIEIDHVKQEARLYSMPDPEAEVPGDQQISFKDSRGEIFADKALIKYTDENSSLKPLKVILAGNVRILNRPFWQGDLVPVMQYIMADRVEFQPQKNEMVFKAAPGKRVLLFDKINGLEVSAPALKIVRDNLTKKDAIKGQGDVRFNFVESEFEQMAQKFSLDKLGPRKKSLEKQ